MGYEQGTLVLGIAVGRRRLALWRDWLMPIEQPFLLPRNLATALGFKDDRSRLTPELRDSFRLYKSGDSALCWLSRPQSMRLAPEVRSSQPGRHL